MRFRRQLKGEMSGKELVGLLVIVATTALVLFFLVGLKDIVVGSGTGECAAGVRAAALEYNIYGRDYADKIEGCQTNELTIVDKQVPDDSSIKRVLANSMLQCWEEWGKGELDLFSEEGQYCHICTIVTIEPEEKTTSLSGQRIERFEQYLQTTNAPVGKKYSEALQGPVPDRFVDIQVSADQEAFYLPKDKPLAVIYWYSKSKAEETLLERWLDVDITPVELAKTVGYASSTAYIVLSGGTGSLKALAGSLVSAEKVGGSIGTLVYVYTRSHDDFDVLSATYLTVYESNNPYVTECENLAIITESP